LLGRDTWSCDDCDTCRSDSTGSWGTWHRNCTLVLTPFHWTSHRGIN